MHGGLTPTAVGAERHQRGAPESIVGAENRPYLGRMKKPFLCLVGRHVWRNRFNDEGQRFQTCDRCGKYRDLIHLADRPGS
jgi:hypothetical protein